jgi:iron(III) transport system substrate-binding protein
MATARTAIRLLAPLAAIAFACATAHAEELTLYSTREANLVEPAVAAFTAATGTTVKTVFIEDSLVKRLMSEGERSPADVLLTIGLDKTTQLAARGLTQPLASPALDQAVPANLRGGDDQWIALAVRREWCSHARTIPSPRSAMKSSPIPNGAADCACGRRSTRTTSR